MIFGAGYPPKLQHAVNHAERLAEPRVTTAGEDPEPFPGSEHARTVPVVTEPVSERRL